MAMSEKEILETIDSLRLVDKVVAIETAGKEKMTKLYEKFVDMLYAEKDFDVCKKLAEALVNIQGADDAILRGSFGFMLDDKSDDATIYGAVVGVGLMDASNYVGVLMRILASDKDSRIQVEAVRAIGNSKNVPRKEDVLHDLEKMLESADEKPRLKSALNKAIGKIRKGKEEDDKIRNAFGSGEEAIEIVQQMARKLPTK